MNHELLTGLGAVPCAQPFLFILQSPLIQGGRFPGYEITENLCAPFIHGFIVDEWETTNHKRVAGSRVMK